MAPKKPALTLKDLQTAASIDDLPTMVSLLAEVERLTTEEAELSKAVIEAASRLQGRHVDVYSSAGARPAAIASADEFDRLTTLTRDGSRRLQRLRFELADAQNRVKEEQRRLQDDIEVLLKPVMLDLVSRLTKALEPAASIDDDLRAVESLSARFLPYFGYSNIRNFNTQEDLRQLARYVGQQAPTSR
jgi:hypothetical protein